MPKQTLKIYISHSIRGKFGNNATPKQMKANCDKAIEFGVWLRHVFPDVKFYVPGEMDEFLIERGVNPTNIVGELLDLDCGIIYHSDGVIVFAPDDHLSIGMHKEKNYADTHKIPLCHITSVNYASIQLMEQVVYKFLKGLGESADKL